MADKLFPFEDPLGQTVDCRADQFLVVGVCDDRMPTGGTGGSQAAEDFNNDVYIPLETCRGAVRRDDHSSGRPGRAAASRSSSARSR